MTETREVALASIVDQVVERTLDLLDMQSEANGMMSLSEQERELAEIVASLAATVTALVLREQRALL